jgi:hypothetical protein
VYPEPVPGPVAVGYENPARLRFEDVAEQQAFNPDMVVEPRSLPPVRIGSRPVKYSMICRVACSGGRNTSTS